MSRLSRSFLGEAISTAASPLLSPSERFDCRSPARSPVTPRRPAFASRDTDGNYRPAQINGTRHVQPAAISAPSRKSTSSQYSAKRSYEHKRHDSPRSIKRSTPPPEALDTASLRPSSSSHTYSSTATDSDHFLPASAQAITPSILPQHYPQNGDQKFGTFTAINLIMGKAIGVGVYSVSSSIYNDLGSAGMTITMWLIGSLISFCGLAVYLDLGSALPRSGGERVYLERIFRHPRMLATCMFGAYVVLLGFSTPNCIVLGQYLLYAIGVTPSTFLVRTIAVLTITSACILHARYPRLGLHTINILGIAKMIILAFVVLSGLFAGVTQLTYVASSAPDDSPIYTNFALRNLFKGTSTSPYAHATALLKILYCFRGYNTANTVLGQLHRPIPTLKRAAPMALSLVSLSYIATNIAYFAVIPSSAISGSDTLIAAHFLRRIFGDLLGERVLPWLIIISAFGNIAATSFAQARVNQELARDNLLPCSGFWAGESPWGGSPAPSLLLHWAVSVAVIVLPPPGPIYEFLVEIGGYPVSVISVAVAGGLLYLQLRSKTTGWQSPIPAPKICTLVFLASNILLLIFPWVEPQAQPGQVNRGRFVYYAYPATGVGVLVLGAYYWVWWRWVRPIVWPEKREGVFVGFGRDELEGRDSRFAEVSKPLISEGGVEEVEMEMGTTDTG
ncbi:MAG: hypothetical protein Q9227_008653 [Pyrenula ochraceoflavens]